MADPVVTHAGSRVPCFSSKKQSLSWGFLSRWLMEGGKKPWRRAGRLTRLGKAGDRGSTGAGPLPRAQVAWLALETSPTGCRRVLLSPVTVHPELGCPCEEAVPQAS